MTAISSALRVPGRVLAAPTVGPFLALLLAMVLNMARKALPEGKEGMLPKFPN